MSGQSGVSAKVYVLYTGGTFGMVASKRIRKRGKKQSSDLTGGDGLKPLALRELEAYLPAAEKLQPGLQVVVESLPHPIDSSSIQPADWLTIAERIAQNYDSFDGFIVIHGTDTLAYTASALSFIFENLAKPVVITGSQVPLLAQETDAADNYRLALRVAAHIGLSGRPLAEVIIAFAGKIMRGNRCRKMSASDWSAFHSPNCKPLASATRGGLRVHRHARRCPARQNEALALNKPIETAVIDITVFPGITVQFLASALDHNNLRGVVLRLFGAGNAPEMSWFLSALKQGIERRKLIAVAVTQCPHGSVRPGHYAAGAGLIDCGVLPGGDMTPEAALTKLMVMLPKIAQDDDKRLISMDLRGEITV